MKTKLLIFIVFLVGQSQAGFSLNGDASDFCTLADYYVYECTSVQGEFNGSDFGDTVKLSNGMSFTFTTYHYTYSYMPKAAILVTQIPNTTTYSYKLAIKDYVYDCIRTSDWISTLTKSVSKPSKNIMPSALAWKQSFNIPSGAKIEVALFDLSGKELLSKSLVASNSIVSLQMILGPYPYGSKYSISRISINDVIYNCVITNIK
ncbi:MAG: hypothetical protein JW915_06695 [Chitinispirillaceae bacterium]|nr:hypothetical protein [Chitinispirillaceae bacterium]